MPFKIQVFVSNRPHMRDPNLEYMLYVGIDALKNMFDHEIVDENARSLQLWYPERWCNIVEERSIFSRAERLYPNLELLQIMTQSVYIIQCTPREDVYIYTEECDLPNESPTGRLWLPNHGIPDFSRLQSFTKS